MAIKAVGSKRKRRVSVGKYRGVTSSRSVRVPDDVWERARSRADSEGVSINYVVNEILDGYSRGMLNLPKVKVVKSYGSAASTAPAVADTQ